MGYTGVGLDLTETKVAQEQQALLINELNHRVKNTLAAVQSLVTRILLSRSGASRYRGAADCALTRPRCAHSRDLGRRPPGRPVAPVNARGTAISTAGISAPHSRRPAMNAGAETDFGNGTAVVLFGLDD